MELQEQLNKAKQLIESFDKGERIPVRTIANLLRDIDGHKRPVGCQCYSTKYMIQLKAWYEENNK